MLLVFGQAIAKLFKGKWTSYLYGILPHPTEPKVLMLRDGNNWSLLNISVNQEIDYYDFGTIKQEIAKQLGITVNILYCANQHYDKSNRRIYGIYVLEQDGSIEELKEGSWIALETLRNLSLIIPEQKSVIEKYLTEIANKDIPKLRPPWARVGWFDSATQWIEEQLQKLNYKQLSPVYYSKSWGISCVLRVSTTAGNIYLKEASRLPLFCDEPIVTAKLAKFFPEHLPTVLSTDPQQHWMLLADFGQPIGRNAPSKLKKDIYRLFAQIQIKSVQYRETLLSVGCLDRRLNRLETQIDVLFQDENALSQLESTEIKQLQAIAPQLKNLCLKLAGYRIPQTLVHGDLHLGNVALFKDNYLFFDWTDSCISHPFFDMFELFFARNNQLSLFSLRSLRDEYLNQWTIYEPKSRLLEAWT
ncbi:MAG: aminoglycoside phosphotransferase family protein, partial [Cyanobacteria bacterium P01_G01_bin.49]